MATQFSSGAQASAVERRGADASEIGTPVDAMAPVIAGARARGIADAFEMLGEGAILLDFSGSVLHVGLAAKPMLGCGLTIAGGHVVATSRKGAQALQRLLEAGLADDAPRMLEADLLCAEEGMRQRVRMVRAPVDAYQLLASVLVLEPPRRVRRHRAGRQATESKRAA